MSRSMRFFSLFALILIVAGVAHAQSWCPKPTGVLTTEYGYDVTAGLRTLAQRIAGERPYLIISRIEVAKGQVPAATLKRARQAFQNSEAMQEEGVQTLITGIANKFLPGPAIPGGDRAIKSAAEEMALDDLFDPNFETGTDTHYHYVFLSDTNLLKTSIGFESTEHGATIEGKPSSTPKLFDAENSPRHPIRAIIEDGNVGAVVFDGVPDTGDVSSLVPDHVPILRISHRDVFPEARDAKHLARTAVTAMQQSTPESNISIVNIFPTSRGEAVAWGFDTIKADAYASAGRHFSSQVEAKGFAANTFTPRSKQDFLKSIEEARQGREAVFVIAEATAEGSIRIPGSADVITKDDFGTMPLGNVYFISCNSANLVPASAGLAFVGRVYTDSAKRLLDVLLPESTDKMQLRETKELVSVSLLDIAAELACLLSTEDQCRFSIATMSIE